VKWNRASFSPVRRAARGPEDLRHGNPSEFQDQEPGLTMNILRDGIGWIGLAVSVAGLGVCAMHFGRVRGVGVLLAGFALQAFSGILFRLGTLLVGRISMETLAPAFTVGSVLALAGGITIVIGVRAVLTGAAAATVNAVPHS
jgi:hypothetical protein